MRYTSTMPLLIGALSLVAGWASPSQAQMEYDVNFFLGQKMLDEDDWAPFEEQGEFAVCSTFGNADWPVKIALDLTASMDDRDVLGVGFEASTTELDAGIRKIWKRNNARPFIGGGLAFVSGEFDIGGGSLDDDGVGAWVDGGVFWRLGRRFNIGFEARISRGEIAIGPFDVEAGGEHFGLLLGFGSPS